MNASTFSTRLIAAVFALLCCLNGAAALAQQTQKTGIEAKIVSERLMRHEKLIAPEAEKNWRVVIARDVFSDYQRFIGQRDPLSLTHFSGPYSRRDVVELVIMQQALHRGGGSRPLVFLLTDSESRTLKALASRKADISGTTLWKSAAERFPEEIPLLSRAVIPEGKFMAGIYFPQGHEGLKTVAAEPEKIRQYSAVCVESWKPDLITLAALGSPVLKTESWSSMLGMLEKQRADYVLAPFQPTADLRLEAEGMVLLPVPGVRVSLAGSRHYLMSANPESQALHAALEKGLEKLEQEGTLQRAYRESGFDNRNLQVWRQLNP